MWETETETEKASEEVWGIVVCVWETETEKASEEVWGIVVCVWETETEKKFGAL